MTLNLSRARLKLVQYPVLLKLETLWTSRDLWSSAGFFIKILHQKIFLQILYLKNDQNTIPCTIFLSSGKDRDPNLRNLLGKLNNNNNNNNNNNFFWCLGQQIRCWLAQLTCASVSCTRRESTQVMTDFCFQFS